MAETATFTRDSLETYEKQPQTKVADTANPFNGATPAKVADAAALAAAEAAALENGDATSAAAEQTDGDDAKPSGDDSVDSDQTASGDGTSDDTADSSTASADPGDETGTSEGTDGADANATSRQAPKKGSAAERLQEVLQLRSEEKDLMEGYKEYGRLKDKELQELRAQLKTGTKPVVEAPVQAAPTADDDPMPYLADEDINFDTDKLRVKTAQWTRNQATKAVRVALEQVNGQGARKQLETEVNTKIATYAADKADFADKVTNNQILMQNQLSPEASLAVAKSDFTGDLLYYFGSNPKEAIRVAKLDPVAQVVEIGRQIGRIEDRKAAAAGSGKPATGAKPVTKKSITQAPPPPSPTRAAGRPAERDETDANMSMEEFANRHREKKQQSRVTARKMRGLN